MTEPTREQIERAVGAVLFNVRNFPEAVQARLLGQDMSGLRGTITDAVVALLSQPAPSAVIAGGIGYPVREAARREDEEARHRAAAAPPRIEDMAPGARITGRSTVTGIWVQATVETGGTLIIGDTHWGASVLDPSTIRDVTPPREDS